MGYGFWIETLGFISGTLGLSIAIPQLARVLIAKQHTGVSTATWVINLINFSIWTGYSIRYNSLSQAVTNIIAAVLTAILVFVLIKQSKNILVATSLVILFPIVSIIAGLYTTEIIMTILLFGVIFATRTPQIIASIKTLQTGRETIVSKTTYLLSSLATLGWIYYGILTGLWWNIVASTIGFILSMIILIIELVALRKRKLVS